MAYEVLAIDPGTTQSAWVRLKRGIPIDSGYTENGEFVKVLSTKVHQADAVVFERISRMGTAAVGDSVFETVFWTGRLFQAAKSWSPVVSRITRMEVKRHLLHSMRGKDGDIRRVILKRFDYDPTARVKTGPLLGISSHKWQALAVGLVWWDRAMASGAWPDWSD